MKEGFRVSLGNYIKHSRIYDQITERECSIPVSPQTESAWRTTAAVLRLADYELDNIRDGKKRKEFIAQSIAFLSGSINDYQVEEQELVVIMRDLKSKLDFLSEDRKDFFMRNLRLLCRVTEKIKHTDDPKEYASLTRMEGQVMGKLFIAFLSREHRSHPNFRNLVDMFSMYGRVGNSVDSFFDLPDDYKNGEIKITPSWKNRLRVLRSSFPDAFRFARGLNLKMAGQLAGAVLDTAQNNSRE